MTEGAIVLKGEQLRSDNKSFHNFYIPWILLHSSVNATVDEN